MNSTSHPFKSSKNSEIRCLCMPHSLWRWGWEMGGRRSTSLWNVRIWCPIFFSTNAWGTRGCENGQMEVVMDETHLHNFRKLGLAVTEEGHGHHNLPCSPHMGWRLTHSPKRSGVHQMRHQRIHPSSSPYQQKPPPTKSPHRTNSPPATRTLPPTLL